MLKSGTLDELSLFYLAISSYLSSDERASFLTGLFNLTLKGRRNVNFYKDPSTASDAKQKSLFLGATYGTNLNFQTYLAP